MIWLWLPLAAAQELPPEELFPIPPPVEAPAPAPAPAPVVPPVSPLDTGLVPWRRVPMVAPSGPNLTEFLPEVRTRGFGSAIGFLVLALLASGGAGAARSLRGGLRPTGLLPGTLLALETVGRALTFVLGIAAIVAMVPDWLVPALPWIAVAGALALGWSLRDALPDVVAWIFLATEGRVRPGQWVRGDGFQGRVEALTLRCTYVVGTRGHRTAVPNRTLIQRPVVAGTDQWPETEVVISLPGLEAAVARKALREAALLSPWLAPVGVPEIGQDPADPTRWTVRVRILDGRYQDRFEGTFPERVHEAVAVHRPPPHSG